MPFRSEQYHWQKNHKGIGSGVAYQGHSATSVCPRLPSPGIDSLASWAHLPHLGQVPLVWGLPKHHLCLNHVAGTGSLGCPLPVGQLGTAARASDAGSDTDVGVRGRPPLALACWGEEDTTKPLLPQEANGLATPPPFLNLPFNKTTSRLWKPWNVQERNVSLLSFKDLNALFWAEQIHFHIWASFD